DELYFKDQGFACKLMVKVKDCVSFRGVKHLNYPSSGGYDCLSRLRRLLQFKPEKRDFLDEIIFMFSVGFCGRYFKGFFFSFPHPKDAFINAFYHLPGICPEKERPVVLFFTIYSGLKSFL